MSASQCTYSGVSRITKSLPARSRALRRVLREIARALFDIRVEGLPNVPAGNFIVVANHLSWLDAFLLLLFLPPEPRIYMTGAAQAVTEPWQARLMTWLDLLIPFERGAHWVRKNPYGQTLAALKTGASLAVFVEGDVGRREGALSPLCRGVGHMLMRVQVPVLPVALSGTRELWWRKPIRMIVGVPFQAAAQGLDHHSSVSAAVTQVETALRRLIPPYVEPPAKRKYLWRLLTNLGGPVAGIAFK